MPRHRCSYVLMDWTGCSRPTFQERYGDCRVAGEHCCSPAPSERHVNLSVYAAQASLKVPRGTRWGAGAPPARYWSGADERYTPETAPAGKLPSSALPPKPVAQTVSCGDTRGKSARFRGG